MHILWVTFLELRAILRLACAWIQTNPTHPGIQLHSLAVLIHKTTFQVPQWLHSIPSFHMHYKFSHTNMLYAHFHHVFCYHSIPHVPSHFHIHILSLPCSLMHAYPATFRIYDQIYRLLYFSPLLLVPIHFIASPTSPPRSHWRYLTYPVCQELSKSFQIWFLEYHIL